MQYLILYLKGIFMGGADIIPGVSGGTIALITGIYSDLINGIHSVNHEVVNDVIHGRFKEGMKRIHWHILLPVFLGILTAVFTMAHLMNYLLETYALYTWSLFFGLIIASAYVIGQQCGLKGSHLIMMILGIVTAFMVVGLVPVNTPDTWWFILLAGAIAICAMILPGISGAFLLLILGKYQEITSWLKAPFEEGHWLWIIVFALGCVIGLLSFSRLLKWLLDHWYNMTLAFLTGMMLGSLRKIWPYREVVEERMISGHPVVIQEKLLLPWQVEGSMLFSFACIGIGILLIVGLEFISRKRTKDEKPVNFE